MSCKKHFVLLTVVLACERSMGTPEPDELRFRLSNGTILESGATVKFKHGKPAEIYCTGLGPGLSVKQVDSVLMETVIVNETAVKMLIENLKPNSYNLRCASKKWKFGYGGYVNVVVDTFPMIEQFRCKIMIFKYINCSWSSNNIRPTFLLHYVDKSGVVFPLCSVKKVYLPRYCIWDDNHPIIKFEESERKTLNFLMTTCNVWGCANQTFEIVSEEVTKVYPARKFSVSRISSNTVALQWEFPFVIFRVFKTDSSSQVTFWDYKITYSYFGNHHRRYEMQVNGTMPAWGPDLTCFDLKLPCPDTFYEIELCIKPSVAVGEEFWSDGVSTSFTTDSLGEGAISDVTCGHQRVKITPEVMLAYVDLLKTKIMEEQKLLKEKIRSMKSKAGRINKPDK